MDLTIPVVGFFSKEIAILSLVAFLVFWLTLLMTQKLKGYECLNPFGWMFAISLTIALSVAIGFTFLNGWAFSSHLLEVYQKEKTAQAHELTFDEGLSDLLNRIDEQQNVSGFFRNIGGYVPIEQTMYSTFLSNKPYVNIETYSVIEQYAKACFSEEFQSEIIEALTVYPVPQKRMAVLFYDALGQSDASTMPELCRISLSLPDFLNQDSSTDE